MAECGPFVLCAIALCFIGSSYSANPYLGKFLGKLSELHHGVSGDVYAVDGRTLHIKDFTYDGQGPGAFFYASTQKSADKNGFRLRDENGKGDVIRRYRKEGVTLTLPDGKNLNNIKIFYVWCEDFDVNFGDVNIARGLDYPRPLKLDALKGVHGISSDNIVIVDAQTLLVPNLSYDGEAPDAKFWVGHGSKPSAQGIRVPDENGKEVPLRRYDRKTVVLTLPGDLTVFDIGHFGIWCEQFTVDFGHVLIPQGLNIPPSLRMLGVSPQKLQNTINIPTKVSQPSPLVVGHLQPTTFRPPRYFGLITRRNDQDISKQYVGPQQNVQHLPVQQQIVPRPQVPESQYLFQGAQPQVFHTQPQIVPGLSRAYQQPLVQLQHLVQPQLLNQNPQERVFRPQVIYLNQQHIPHNSINLNLRQFQEQQPYNLYVKRIQDEQLRKQLSSHFNRFNLLSNQKAYVQLD